MTRLTEMTFNIRGSLFGMDEENLWENRAELNLATIKKYDPDIIAFQEYQSGNQALYDERLPEYAYELGLKTIHDGEYYHQTPIYWKKDRFELLDTGAFYLSETPDEWSVSWDSSLVRAAMWVVLREKPSGITFMHLNTHLDHIGEEARVEGSKLIVRKIMARRGSLPVIVTGDFNSRVWEIREDSSKSIDLPEEIDTEFMVPAGTVHRVYTDAGFKDTYLESGNEDHADTNTFHAFKGCDFPPLGMRIDWILTLDAAPTGGGGQQFTAHRCDIIKDEQPPLYPSDHYPVLAEVELSAVSD